MMKGLGVVLLATVAMGGVERSQESAAPAMDLEVKPRVAHSPGTIKATATIERDPRNRELTIVVESGTYFASSSRSLDGEYSARTHTRVFKRLPPGTYEVRATVERNDRTTLVDLLQVTVVGSAHGSARPPR